jgi:hypothetical protein
MDHSLLLQALEAIREQICYNIYRTLVLKAGWGLKSGLTH